MRGYRHKPTKHQFLESGSPTAPPAAPYAGSLKIAKCNKTWPKFARPDPKTARSSVAIKKRRRWGPFHYSVSCTSYARDGIQVSCAWKGSPMMRTDHIDELLRCFKKVWGVGFDGQDMQARIKRNHCFIDRYPHASHSHFPSN